MRLAAYEIERGYTLIDSVWSLVIGAILVSGATTLFVTISHAYSTVSSRQQGLLSALKTRWVVATALRATERNRLRIATTITSGGSLTLTNGGRHPVATIGGTSAPRVDSDILSFIELANLHRGLVRSFKITGMSAVVEACGLSSAPRPNSYRSYLLLSVSGPLQVAGDLAAVSKSCVRLSGTILAGLISNRAEVPLSVSTFVPIEREYSIFVDRSSNLRLASHVGTRLVENQPIARGIYSLRVTSESHPTGAIIFHTWIKPTIGLPIRGFVIPALTSRSITSETLP
jgi:hypothetical protein